MRALLLLASLPLLIVACDDSPPDAPAAPKDAIAGHCVYTNPFSKQEECSEFHGAAWTAAAVAEDCNAKSAAVMPGACGYSETLGTCVIEEAPNKAVHIVMPGDDPSLCSNQKLGCEVFGGGAFIAAGVCANPTTDTPEDPNTTVFQPPVLVCSDPLPGEPVGQSEDGKVCTWQMISGCTEPGRKFIDYASCEPVYTQRPYFPVPPAGDSKAPDARLNDPAYVAELDWVKSQVESAGCVCCHQKSITPEGASVWDIEAEGNWVNTFSPYGLAISGGFLDSSLLGAYPASENNGFSRDKTGIPTTDPARMAAFFEKELAYRGFSPDFFADWTPIPEVFYQQSIYEPSICQDGEGVGADLTLQWSGGGARYIYVLEANAENPGVPPNLDLPEGTLWRIDVSPADKPLKSGEVRYGDVPQGKKQAFPSSGAPKELEPGKQYYLYAAADVMVPITRCLFTFSAK
ncbi:MAG: proteinase inhibitor [Polyangiaceae bacterium]|nr:proteinase inhibitor [Polyangiaceae bacterium]